MTKSEIIATYAQHEGDTGSPEVQNGFDQAPHSAL